MSHITAHCCAFYNGSVGGSEWRRAKEDADALFQTWKDDASYDEHTLVRFDLEVPMDMSNDMVTYIVDSETQSLQPFECIEIRLAADAPGD